MAEQLLAFEKTSVSRKPIDNGEFSRGHGIGPLGCFLHQSSSTFFFFLFLTNEASVNLQIEPLPKDAAASASIFKSPLPRLGESKFPLCHAPLNNSELI